MKVLYTAKATTIGGRAGTAKTDDGVLDLKLSAPGVNKPGTTNPEQLFACGYAACFGGAVEFVARSKKIDPGTVTVASEVSLRQGDDGFSLAVILNVSLANVSGPEAEALVKEAHGVCPYSKATRGNIDVQLKVAGQPLKAAA